jgi:hypothetical protein
MLWHDKLGYYHLLKADHILLSEPPKREIEFFNLFLEAHEVMTVSSSTFVKLADYVTWQVPPLSPGMIQRQPSVGNVLARTSSFGSSTGAHSGTTATGVTRQGSQTSLFEQLACTAKELVRETTRQSSQDGLLAQMDKVRRLKF